MTKEYNKIKTLFLSQSYVDSWDSYEKSIDNSSFITWDYIVLTASNEEQANTYRAQIKGRLENGQLSDKTKYIVLPDPDGKRVGSGGATFNALKYVKQNDPSHSFRDKRTLVIHSGGDSKRVPQYSACGKLFSLVPRELPDGRGSTLFDELIIGMSAIPSRFKEGMLVLSGDVLPLFNPLQIDAMINGAAVISVKEHISIGKNHGVFLNDGHDNVAKFLHKQTEERLRELGAVNEKDCVNLDTGAVLFDCDLMDSLYGLVDTDEKFERYVNETARISFYGDLLYPLATQATLEDYLKEAAEGTINDELIACRKEIWDVTRGFSMKLICPSPSEFIHFGTTKELRQLVNEKIDEYAFLGWRRHVVSSISDINIDLTSSANEDKKRTVSSSNEDNKTAASIADKNSDFASHNAYIDENALIGSGSYIENSCITGNSRVGKNCVISGVTLNDASIPDNTVLNGLMLKNGKHCIRIYGVDDNPKGGVDTNFLSSTLSNLINKNNLSDTDIFDKDLLDLNEKYLWYANLFPACDTEDEAVHFADIVYKMAKGTAPSDDIAAWRSKERLSLYSSFMHADPEAMHSYEKILVSRILSKRFCEKLANGVYYKQAFEVFGRKNITEDIFNELMNIAKTAPDTLKIRIFYAISSYMRDNRLVFSDTTYDVLEAKCFGIIRENIYNDALSRLPKNIDYTIKEDEVNIALPVRVNWGGGWTDTPPQCNELGGVVLNAAITLNGTYPVQVTVRRLNELHVEFESQDIGVKGTVTDIDEIRNSDNPYDSFTLHKAALIACGLIPLEGNVTLESILKKLGGGIYLSTQVIGIPKGSGLGTSSILSAACVKAIFRFLGVEIDDFSISDIVLSMEQIMSTGGGWQDQIGGLISGIKYTTSKPSIRQQLTITPVEIADDVKKELNERFALIYTGQRRLARNLLRDVVGGYIGARPETVDALKKMSKVATLMRLELERGDVDAFAELLDEHWELSKQLDSGSTNTCIDYIFLICDDLICGKLIAGAGGGGFLQVILKKGVTKQMLRERINDVFEDSGVEVWDSEFVF